jgi:hypothetical protein
VLEQGWRLLLDGTQHWSTRSIFPWRRCSGEVDVETERRASAVRSTAAGAIGHAIGRALQLVKGRGGVGGRQYGCCFRPAGLAVYVL